MFFSFLRFFPLGGWGGPEKDWVLQHCLIHGLAIIHHLVQVLLQGMFPGSGSGLISCGMVFMVRDPIMVWGAFPGQRFVTLLTILLALQVRAHGTSGSSVLSEEPWLGSMGCELLTLAGSVVCFLLSIGFSWQAPLAFPLPFFS